MDAQQQHELEVVQDPVPHPVWKHKHPGMGSRMIRPFELPLFRVTEKIHLGHLAFPCVPQHQLAEQQRWSKWRVMRIVAGFQNVQLGVDEQCDLNGDPFALNRQKVQLEPPRFGGPRQEAAIKHQAIGPVHDGRVRFALPGGRLQQKRLIECAAQVLASRDNFMPYVAYPVQSLRAPAEVG